LSQFPFKQALTESADRRRFCYNTTSQTPV